MGEKIASMYAEITADTTKLQTGLTQTKTGMQQASAGASSLIKSFLPLATVGGAAALGFKALKDSINETVAYNKQIREISQFTGMAVDETARLVQVADDWGVTSGEVRQAMQVMSKNGVQPSIENLAKLADEFVNAADKTAFAEEKSKIFGRQWTTLVPILAQGGQSLKDQAAAINSALIPTEEMIRKTRAWEEATDNLDDTLTGLKYTIGDGVIPPLTRMLNLVNDTITRQSIMNDAVKEGIVTREQVSAVNLREAQTGQVDLKFWKDLADRLYTIHDAVSSTTHVFPGYRGQLKGATQDTEDLAAKSKILEQSLSDLKQIVAGDLTRANMDYIESVDDLIDQQDELEEQTGSLEAKISKLSGKKYLTKAQKQELEDTRNELENNRSKLHEIELQIDKNAEARAREAKMAMFDLLTQRAEIDGVSEAEYKALSAIAESWGLIDGATKNAIDTGDKFFDTVNSGAPVSEGAINDLAASMSGPAGVTAAVYAAKHAVQLLNAEFNKAPKDINVNYHLVIHGKVPGHTYAEPGYASGGFIPPGQWGMTGEQGPEPIYGGQTGVTVVPNNKMGGGGGDTYNSYNITNLNPKAAAINTAMLLNGRRQRLNASMGG